MFGLTEKSIFRIPFVREVLVAMIILVGLVLRPAYAQSMPTENIGIWAETSCKEGNKFFLVNSSAALVFNKAQKGFTVVFGSTTAVARTVIISRPEGTLILPNMSKLIQCSSLPSEFYATFGEAITLFKEWTNIDKTCQSDTGSRCLNAVLNLVDVSREGRISQAEISRILRGASLYIGYELAIANRVVLKREENQAQYGLEVGMTELFGAAAMASLVAPTISSGLLASYDYDGDGFLSMKEILQDRSSENIQGLLQSAEAGTMQLVLQQLIIFLQKIVAAAPGFLGGMIFR